MRATRLRYTPPEPGLAGYNGRLFYTIPWQPSRP